jgi:hypothetical protein
MRIPSEQATTNCRALCRGDRRRARHARRAGCRGRADRGPRLRTGSRRRAPRGSRSDRHRGRSLTGDDRRRASAGSGHRLPCRRSTRASARRRRLRRRDRVLFADPPGSGGSPARVCRDRARARSGRACAHCLPRRRRVLRPAEWWGVPIRIDFHFMRTDVVVADLERTGLEVEMHLERRPYDGVEHPSNRCYVFARRGAGLPSRRPTPLSRVVEARGFSPRSHDGSGCRVGG